MTTFFSNNAQSEITSEIDDETDPVTFTVQDGTRFAPFTPADGHEFYAMIDAEIFRVYGNEELTPGVWTFTADRALEGTFMTVHPDGALVTLSFTEESINTKLPYLGQNTLNETPDSITRWGTNAVSIPDATWTNPGTGNLTAYSETQAGVDVWLDTDGIFFPYLNFRPNLLGLALSRLQCRMPTAGASTIGWRIVDSTLSVIRQEVWVPSPDFTEERINAEHNLGFGQNTGMFQFGGFYNYAHHFEVYQKSGAAVNLTPDSDSVTCYEQFRIHQAGSP